jgi:hypothetical protein
MVLLCEGKAHGEALIFDGAALESRRWQRRSSFSFRVDDELACSCSSSSPHDLRSHSLRPTYRAITSGMTSTWHLADSLVHRLLDVAATFAGPSWVAIHVPRSFKAQRRLHAFKKTMPVSLTESASHPSSSGAGLRRAAACGSLRASVGEHYTLVAQCVAHTGYSLHLREVRALARCAHVMLISAAQRRPRRWNKNKQRIRSV